jgi:hypothetical protein
MIMGFDIEKFRSTKFMPREEDISVPDLAEFFAEDEKPVWRLRGLTGPEMAKVNEAVTQNKNLAETLEKIVSQVASEKTEAILEALSLTDNVPDDIVRRIALLKMGSVEPKMTQEACVKMAEYFPVPFYSLTTKVIELTGHGYKNLGESIASGQTNESK